MIERVGIIIRKGRVYIPVHAKGEPGGPYVAVEPVIRADLEVTAIAKALAEVAAHGHPLVPSITRAAWDARTDPILRATGVKSWKQVATDSASYGIGWNASGVTISLHALDAKGRFCGDVGRMQFLPGTPSRHDIAQVIVADVQRLPELGFVDVRLPYQREAPP